jgi:hypothetical protein
MSFFATYLCLALFLRFAGWPRAEKAVIALAAWASTALVAWSRSVACCPSACVSVTLRLRLCTSGVG